MLAVLAHTPNISELEFEFTCYDPNHIYFPFHIISLEILNLLLQRREFLIPETPCSNSQALLTPKLQSKTTALFLVEQNYSKLTRKTFGGSGFPTWFFSWFLSLQSVWLPFFFFNRYLICSQYFHWSKLHCENVEMQFSLDNRNFQKLYMCPK